MMSLCSKLTQSTSKRSLPSMFIQREWRERGGSVVYGLWRVASAHCFQGPAPLSEGAIVGAAIDRSSRRVSVCSTEPSEVDLKFKTLPQKQNETSVVAADRRLRYRSLILRLQKFVSARFHVAKLARAWNVFRRSRSTRAFELGKRSLRDRNSPTCTLSQNGYGDGIPLQL